MEVGATGNGETDESEKNICALALPQKIPGEVVLISNCDQQEEGKKKIAM